jgi:ATP-dependent Clp protease ATP-binding subunit ClpC
MYDNFTDGVRHVIKFANQEASRYNHCYIGTEHLLLGLIETPGFGGEVLKELGLRAETIRTEIEKIILTGDDSLAAATKLPQTPKMKKVVEQAIAEAKQLGHHYVGTEHLLLGLVHDTDNVAAQILLNLGVNRSLLRAAVFTALGIAAPGDANEKLD